MFEVVGFLGGCNLPLVGICINIADLTTKKAPAYAGAFRYSVGPMGTKSILVDCLQV